VSYEVVDEDNPLWPAVRDAIQAKLSEDGMGMLHTFIGMVEYVTPEGEDGFAIICPDEQLHKDTISMLQFMNARELEIQRINIHAHLMGEHDDD
jgi:hypothetical protein